MTPSPPRGRRWAGRLAAAWLVGSVLAALPATAAEPATAAPWATAAEPVVAAEPALAADRTAAKAGDQVLVRVAGWAPGNLLLEVCGNEAANGSVDCAVGSSVNVPVQPDGTGAAVLPITRPPAPCPCVLRARALVGGAMRAVPLVIHGVASRPPGQPATARQSTRLGITATRWGDAGPGWVALFAGPARHTLRVTVRNTGAAPVRQPRLSVVAGRTGQPTAIVVVPPLGGLEPGQQRTVDIPVTFGAPTWGAYTARVEVSGAAQPVVGYAHTTSYPWVLLIVVSLGGALAVRRLLCRAGAPRRWRARVPSSGHD